MDKLSSPRSFTLIELLVVIGILAILTAAVVVVLNPAEYLKQARDTTRMNDLGQINQALTVLESQGVTSFGTANTVYVSLTDTTSTCANLGLPTLPSGYSYHCVASSTLQKIDSTGWIPVDFTQSTALAFSNLPLDPVNTTSTGNYYTYTPGGSWELDAIFESGKDRANTTLSKTNLPGVYAKGSNLTLSPLYNNSGLVGYWSFDEGSGSTVADKSGNGNTGTWHGSGSSHWATGKVGSAGQFNGSNDQVTFSMSTLNPNTSITLIAWVKLTSYTTQDSKNIITLASLYDPYDAYYLSTHWNYYLIARAQSDVPVAYSSSHVTSISAGNWFLAAEVVNRSDNSIKAYLNGVLGSSGDTISSSFSNIANGSIGGWWSFVDATIDDVRIYSRALSAAEIMAIYNSTK